jgi:hypothetical protein
VSTAGNWVFKDNLFDKVAFVQDTTNPLDQDFNAYWKRLPEELEPWETDRLWPDASNDRVLAAAPVYQTGPLGDFYLTTSSPLYQAGNRGSRSVTDAGLYHYTMKTTQEKDGVLGGNVVIGRHYVATTSSSTNRPKDSETPTGDGVPDYVEDANGNNDANDISNGIETSPSLAQTLTGTADSLHTIYDDIDLDGDGMVGRIERALEKLPLTSDSQLTVSQVMNGYEPDMVSFVVPINYEALTALGTLNLFVDGEMVKLDDIREDAQGNCLLTWNTTFTTWGDHFVNVRFNRFGSQGAQQSGTPDPTTLSAAGPPISFPINSILRFSRFFSEFSDHGYLYADLAVEDADYVISLHNPAAGPSAPAFRTISGSTGNGVIDEAWDVTDQNGNAYMGDNVIATFAVTPDGGTPETHSYVITRLDLLQFFGDHFTVAYAWDDTSVHTHMTFAMQNVVDVLLNPFVYGLNNPYSSTFNLESQGGLGGIAGYCPDDQSKAGLLTSLSHSVTRNFFFHGHGSADSIGDGKGTDANPVPNAFNIVSGEIVQVLNNRDYPIGQGRFEYRRNHPYRFVFLDACNTADTTTFADAFGIRHSIDFMELGREPFAAQAFVGWKGKPRAPEDDDEWDDYGFTLFFFFSQWMQEVDLQTCIARARERDPFGDGSVILDFTLGERFGIYDSGWGKGLFGNTFKIRIYGYPWITRTSFN